MEMLDTAFAVPTRGRSSASASDALLPLDYGLDSLPADVGLDEGRTGDTSGGSFFSMGPSRVSATRVEMPTPVGHTTIAQWMGHVQDVLPNGDIVAQLRALSLVGEAAPASAEGFEEWATIPADQIEQEDRTFVRPGAIFYLTVLKQKRTRLTVGGHTIMIVFRRAPTWSTALIQKARARAAELHGRIHRQAVVQTGVVEPRRTRTKSAYQANAIKVITTK